MAARVPTAHVPSPYSRPTARLAARVEVPCPDGATVVAWCYAPDGTDDAPGTPFGVVAGRAPVLLLHGNGEEHGIFGPTIDAVVASGRTAVALDSRAQGQSTRGTAPLTYELMAADAREACERLGVWRAHVLGFSDGAILGLLLARDWGAHVMSLTAIGANLRPSQLGSECLAWALDTAACLRDWAREGWEGALDENGVEAPSPAQAAVTAELVQLMANEPHIDEASLARVSCPTTVMSGSLDDIAPEVSASIARAVPNSVLVVAQGLPHNLPKQAPDLVSAELLRTVACNDAHRAPAAPAPVAGLRVVPLPATARWRGGLDALYRAVTAQPGTSGWAQDAWPPAGMAGRLLEAGAFLGAFREADLGDGGTPLGGARLLGAVAVDLDAAMGDEDAPGHGSGLGGPTWEPLGPGEAACPHLLAVDPEARGQGVARALVDAAARRARELGARSLRLCTSVANVEANGLYESLGLVRHAPVWMPYEGLDLPGWSNLWELAL